MESRPSEAQSTVTLLERHRGGDLRAREILLARYLPVLERWASGRLPLKARSLADTSDLVQVTMIRALNRLDSFEPQREGAFLAYLRTILLNAVREELRRHERLPRHEELDESIADPSAPAIDSSDYEQYERALETLGDLQREAVVLRLEFGFSHQQVADAIGSPSANSARMVVSRALVKLAKAMQD